MARFLIDRCRCSPGSIRVREIVHRNPIAFARHVTSNHRWSRHRRLARHGPLHLRLIAIGPPLVGLRVLFPITRLESRSGANPVEHIQAIKLLPLTTHCEMNSRRNVRAAHGLLACQGCLRLCRRFLFVIVTVLVLTMPSSSRGLSQNRPSRLRRLVRRKLLESPLTARVNLGWPRAPAANHRSTSVRYDARLVDVLSASARVQCRPFATNHIHGRLLGNS